MRVDRRWGRKVHNIVSERRGKTAHWPAPTHLNLGDD